MKFKKVMKTVILSVICLILLAALAAVWWCISFAAKHGDTLEKLKKSALEIAEASKREDFCAALTSSVYASDGTVISLLKAEKDVYYLEYDEIPKEVIQTFIAVEDRRFYKHNGIDYKGIMRAAWSLYANKEITQGGSTITQQLSRNIYLSHEVTWERKIEEMFLAMALEEKYSKQDILEFYVNNIYFANGNYGIQAAARGYFDKDVSELSLSEIVFLCAIPNNPSKYDPLTNMPATISRRDEMLNTLYELGLITRSAYKEAVFEKPVLKLSQPEKNNYVETYIYDCAARLLMTDDMSYNEALMSLYTGGYGIYTSIDLSLQAELQNAVDDRLSEFSEVNDEGIYALQGAAVCIDNATGYVVAIVGGREQGVTGYTLNRAFQSYRQPGSAIKPLVTYTPLLAQGYTADTIVNDEKTADGPANSNNRYSGEITLRQAVAQSKNTVAWELFQEITPRKGLQYLLDMNFKKIVDSDYVPAAALGGLTYGATPLEMTAAYAAIENDGKYRVPDCIEKITDSKGNVIYEAKTSEKQIYTVYSSRVMTDILESVMTEGTGRASILEGMSCAGKTGTTDKNKDGWFIGYTPYYTTGVWVGYDMPREMDDLYGYTYPAGIWKTYMQKIHEGLPDKEFPTPEEYLREWEQKQREEAEANTNKDNDKENDNNEREPLTDAGVDWEDETTAPFTI